MASQNIIETINSNGHKIEIYQDAASKYRWKAINENVENVGSSEQGFKTLELCKQNLLNLAEVIGVSINSKIKMNDVGSTKVEVMSDSDGIFDSGSTSFEEQKAMDWNIFWLMVIILLLSIFIFARVFFPR
jgi:uncharacterized protein YegP (UPF0339 family)